MDRDHAIAAHHAALVRIVAALVAMAGLAGGIVPAGLSRPVCRAVMRVLRPAESAVRRLIVIMAHGTSAPAPPARPWPAGLRLAASARERPPTFALFDLRWRFGKRRPPWRGPGPRITIFGAASPLVPLFRVPVEPPAPVVRPERPAFPERLGRRLAAIALALETLPAQARRLKRWQARGGTMIAARVRSPLRPGPPPFSREEPEDEVDFVLARCHLLAWETLNTS